MFLTFPSWPLGRADPECMLGHLLKILFKNDDFMNAVRMNYDLYKIRGRFFASKLRSDFLKKIMLLIAFPLQLVNSYVMTSREFSLNAAACRLLQNIMPGLETAVVFQEKVPYLFLFFKL